MEKLMQAKEKKEMKERMIDMSCEDIYADVNKRMTTALMFHANMSDYFSFMGLHGFRRIHECQYFEESIGKRKLHRKVLDFHNKLIPELGHDKLEVVPADWYKHTRMDIDDSVLAKFVKTALKQYKEWEEETKCFYECVAHVFLERGEMIDYELMMCYVKHVQCELKKIYRLCEELNEVGYDVLYIMEVQKRIHEEYKNKMKKLKVQK